MAAAFFSYPKRSSSSLPSIPISSSPHTTRSSPHLKLPSQNGGAATHAPHYSSSTHLLAPEAQEEEQHQSPHGNEYFLGNGIEGAGGHDYHLFFKGVVSAASRRRKRRRKGANHENREEDNEFHVVEDRKKWNSKFMSLEEEARLCSCLQERARIEAVRRNLLAEMSGEEEEEEEGLVSLSSSQWAKAAGISQRKLDKILCKGRQSEERITVCYHRLVISVASSHQGKGLSMQDLIQEGSIGLLHAALKFNPEKGYKLSTYAYWWIRQHITRAIAKKANIIRMPGTVNELMPRICEAINVLNRQLQRFPTYNEITEATNISSSVVRLAVESSKNVISIERAMTSQGSMSLQEIIPGPEEMTPEDRVRRATLKQEMHKLLKRLCEREAQILRLHYGLHGGTPCSFEEIGRRLKLSRERVRQLNSVALGKLQGMEETGDLKYLV